MFKQSCLLTSDHFASYLISIIQITSVCFARYLISIIQRTSVCFASYLISIIQRTRVCFARYLISVVQRTRVCFARYFLEFAYYCSIKCVYTLNSIPSSNHSQTWFSSTLTIGRTFFYRLASESTMWNVAINVALTYLDTSHLLPEIKISHYRK